ncbi:MAG TPA: asparagine synthase-related protein [Pyrinomonadaceae bacterium]
MSLFAGIINRDGRPLPDSVCSSLGQSISRNPVDKVISFRYANAYFAKIDIGAFGEPGFVEDEHGALSLLTGEPLLSVNSAQDSNRLDELRTLHDQALLNNWDAFKGADGTFCFVHYQPQTGSLTLVGDKVGVRPLHFWMDDELVVFASTLHVLEECPLVPKKMNLRAVTEMVALDAPLGDRTPYARVRLLKAGEIVEITKEVVSTRSYWQWDQIETSSDPEPVRLQTIHDRFQTAVQRRIRNDKATAAYLSGGLDSRLCVAALIRDDVNVHSFNFARPGTQDYLFGNDFAEKIGSIHQSLPKQSGDSVPDYSSLMANALKNSNSDQEHPRLVWSGEGGSVLLGLVHLNESIIESMRAGNMDRAIEEFLEREQTQIPAKLFRPQVLLNSGDLIKQGLREELEASHAKDAGRNFYLFLMLNDQRRKLALHFENLDLHRLEFQLPFFDGAFLEAVIATPLDWYLRHTLYVKWLSLFPPAVTEVPWQGYPGHEPCPLPIPASLAYQWDENHQANESVARKRRVLRNASEVLHSAHFPNKILSKRNLRLAAWLHSTGWRDYQYAIEAAETYHKYAKNCGGNFSLSLS